MKKKRKKKTAGRRAGGRATRAKKARGKTARKKSVTKAKSAVRRKKIRKKRSLPRTKSRDQGYVIETLVGLPKPSRRPVGLQSGDLQGLSNDEVADSESVDELLEEGNAFEAGVVAGVEDSRDEEGKEVRTREVPVDDVPDEYLEKD
jgi:hypothetical protein